MTHIIVVGNEKGGSGKSTTAMHLIVYALREGKSVGSMDLDTRQRTLSRYLANRQAYRDTHAIELPMPEHRVMEETSADEHYLEAKAKSWFIASLGELKEMHDLIVIDTPGYDAPLGRLGHSYGDSLITPLNDSFIDLDVLARVDPHNLEIKGPSQYAELVWQQRIERNQRKEKPIDWIILRNRLSHLDAFNKRKVEQVLDRLSKRIGFRMLPGLGERVIYRDLFLEGLTSMDLSSLADDRKLSRSDIFARQEIRSLYEGLKLAS